MSVKAEVNMAWRDLSYSIANKKEKDGVKWILHPQAGQAGPGDLLALMGPSGSGKTSLLNALAGRLPVTKGAAFKGTLQVNGMEKSSMPCAFADVSAYVEQEDVLYALSTVQETLDFSARLRLPVGISEADRNATIEEVLKQLGLVHVRKTNVGGSSFNGSLRGLSGGERKRLSIAIELLHRPKALFLDEPTTGLDSYQALNVMEKLRTLAREGHTVVVSIHQPRSSIFAMFTGVYLLANGRQVYSGPTDGATEYFASLGYELPPKFNPADFFIDLVSIDQRDEEEQARTEKIVSSLQSTWSEKSVAFQRAVSGDADEKAQAKQSLLSSKPLNPAGQSALFGPFILLLRRNWREQMRDKIAVLIKSIFQVFFTFIFAFVYFQMGYSQSNIQDRLGFLFFLTMNQAFGSVIGCAQVLPRQLVVVNRERANRLYSIFPFYLSALTVVIPIEAVPNFINNIILFFLTNLSGSFWVFFAVLLLENLVGISLGMVLSACFSNVTMASQIAPAVVILFLIFSGFLVNEGSVPVYFMWLRESSFIRYAFKAVVVNELEGTKFECDRGKDPVCIENGEQVLAQLEFDEENLILKCIIILTIIMVVFNFLAFAILLLRRPKFLALTPGAASPQPEVSDNKADVKPELAAKASSTDDDACKEDKLGLSAEV